MSDSTGLSAHDLTVLRTLGEWAAQAAASAANRAKWAAWQQHDAGVPGARVMVIAETFYTTGDTLHAVNDHDLQCRDPWARSLEQALRYRQFEVEVLQDDHLVAPYIAYAPAVLASDFGVPAGIHRQAGADQLAFQYHAPLQSLDEADFARLHPRTFTWQREEDERTHARLEAIFAGILPVRRRNHGWQLHLPITSTCLGFVGLEGFMTLMYDNPAGLHRLLAFIRDDQLAYLHFMQEHQLLELNNEADYVGSGCMGCTQRLPAADFAGQVRPQDLWYFCESQESVGIGPQQYAEFVFPYVRALAEPFGRVYYGCCEAVDPVWDTLSTLPNLQRVSISPWANEEAMGRYCRTRGVVYSRKPRPNLFMGPVFDEAAMRAHLEHTVACTADVRLEFILRDVYTVNNEPQRFVRFVELVREAAAQHRG